MKDRITNTDFIKAEKTASERDLHIRRAIAPYRSGSGEIEILNPRKVIKLVKPRPENSHKGSFGRLVLISGSDRFPGAAQLSALAALRSGAGLVTVITTSLAAEALASSVREATLLPLDSDGAGFMLPNGKEETAAGLIASADALLIGPGLGTAEGSLKMLEIALENAACPIILDADGINLVSTRIEFLRKAKTGLILTPHPAELARLSGAPLAEVLGDRLKYARKIAEEYGCTVVSKSSGTLITGGGKIALSVRGNNGLARGGSGDLLAGLIASFAAQGYSPAEAAEIGVTLQGLACEIAAKRLSRRGVLPSDIIDCLPLLFKKIERLI